MPQAECASLTIVVLGCGRVGAQIATDAASDGHAVSVVDRDQASFARLPAGFAGRTCVGDGIDRTALEAAGVAGCDALAAVMYGDNSNIVAARIAKETYAVPSVVARIKDPGRAEVYQRLGIPTVAPVTWATNQVLRRLYADGAAVDWTHPSGATQLIEHELPLQWAGHLLDPLMAPADGYRLIMLTRGGRPRFASPGLSGQEGDLLHALINVDAGDAFAEALHGGPRS